jgi:hypothetical protein
MLVLERENSCINFRLLQFKTQLFSLKHLKLTGPLLAKQEMKKHMINEVKRLSEFGNNLYNSPQKPVKTPVTRDCEVG